MSYERRPCFLCNARGAIDIGDNIFIPLQPKRIKCPHCHGKGYITIHRDPGDKNNRKGFGFPF